MLTNMESQLKEQGALDRMDRVLQEIPKVREDLGFIPLVTPTSQIVGTQAVINVLAGERYRSITKETAGVLKGEYGATPAPVNGELQRRVLDGAEPIVCRPADLMQPELAKLTGELKGMAADGGVKLAEAEIDDVLTYALFPQVGWKFLQNRGNPDVFEPAPGAEPPPPAAVLAEVACTDSPAAYNVTVNGTSYFVEVAPGGAITSLQPAAVASVPPLPFTGGEIVKAPMAGHVLRITVKEGQVVAAGEVVVVMEAMKMETEVRTRNGGRVASVPVKVGDPVGPNDTLAIIH
jgi:oxaloacetate decarboxylase alpha subunit